MYYTFVACYQRVARPIQCYITSMHMHMNFMQMCLHCFLFTIYLKDGARS